MILVNFFRKIFSRFPFKRRKTLPEIPIIINNDPHLNFEKLSWWYFLMLPLILLLALWVAIKKKILGENLKTNTFWFDGVSKNCRMIKENAGRWKALDLIYNNYYKEEDFFFGRKVYNFYWHNLKSAKAVRNRLKLIKILLLKNIINVFHKGKKVKLISIASGSAQGVIETIVQAKRKGILVKGILIDIDQTALEHAKELAQQAGVKNQIFFINKTASFVKEIGREFRPNLIEMVGFLEYRPKEKAIKLIQTIYQVLDKGGVFLVSQITPNTESFFLKEVINWPMVYRRLKEFADLLEEGRFSLKNCKFYREPLKIHYIAECRKI